MKHLLLNLILVVTTFSAHATIIDPKLTPSDAQSFNLYFEDWNAEEVKVQILNDASIEIMSETIDLNNTNARKYNLKNLPLGSYTVIVSNKLKSIEHPLTLNRNSVEFDYHNIVKNYKPVFNTTDEYIDINFLNLDSETKLTIRDINGNVLVSKNYEQSKAITQRFDMSALPKGTYYIAVNTVESYYSKPFTVR